jgi:DNA mismatch repair ATPase MutS
MWDTILFFQQGFFFEMFEKDAGKRTRKGENMNVN